MADRITVISNASEIARILGGLAHEQVPFATAQALTTAAFAGQRRAKQELEQSLATRNRFSITGIQVNRAEKSDWPNTFAEVGIEEQRSYLIDHVTGGKRQGDPQHGRAILDDLSLRSNSGRVPKRSRPGTLIQKSQRAARQRQLEGAFGSTSRRKDRRLPFLIYSSKFGNEVLVRRQGKDRYPLEIVYAFKTGVQIKRQFEMDLAVQLTVQKTYNTAFGKALQKALRTAKPKDERASSRSRGTPIYSGR